MHKILNKIVVPVSASLIILFIALTLIVSKYSSELITNTFIENFEVITNQIEGNVIALDKKIEDFEEIEYDSVKSKITSLVDMAISKMQAEYDRYQAGLITEEMAKKNSLDTIRDLKYDGDGYFWIDNTDYINVLLPPNPSAQGLSRYDLVDKKGIYIVREFIDKSVQNGDNFLNYWFPKPGETETFGKAQLH